MGIEGKTVPDWINPYGWRDQNLKTLGFADYPTYLASSLWKNIRHRAISAHPTCFRCGKRAQQVHHASYDPETLSGKTLAALIPCCAKCHRAAEKQARGLRGEDRLNEATVYLTHHTKGWRKKRSKPSGITWIPEHKITLQREPRRPETSNAKRARRISERNRAIPLPPPRLIKNPSSR